MPDWFRLAERIVTAHERQARALELQAEATERLGAAVRDHAVMTVEAASAIVTMAEQQEGAGG